MNPIKFYRVETLPETGEVGSLYFVFGNQIPSLHLCTTESTFECYGSDLTECMKKIDSNAYVTSAALNDLNKDKQNKEDNSLLTSDKTVIGAINEIKQIVDISIPLLKASL